MSELRNIEWKNLQGIQLENEFLSVVILPSLGGKIASIFEKGKEVELTAQNEEEYYKIPEWGADFSQYDASGLDEAFPNITAADIVRNGERCFYPDHGEIWSGSFSYQKEKEGVRLSYQSKKFGYIYEKKICLRKNCILLSYDIRNEYVHPFPCIWTFHGLMRYEEDMEFLYAEEVERFENVFDSEELGAVGERYERKNTKYNFERVPERKANTMVKFYVDGKLQRGFCGYRYPALGVECRYHYDAEKLPYLGVWITAGGFRGDYNCAMEPANGYYDDIRNAERNNKLYYLKKENPLKFSLEIEVCRLGNKNDERLNEDEEKRGFSVGGKCGNSYLSDREA